MCPKKAPGTTFLPPDIRLRTRTSSCIGPLSVQRSTVLARCRRKLRSRRRWFLLLLRRVPTDLLGERFLPWEPVRYLLPSEGRSGAPVDLAGPRAVRPPHRRRDGSPPLREPLPEAAQD